MQKTALWSLALALVALGAVGVLVPGCEEDTVVDDLSAYFAANPYISQARTPGTLPLVVTPSIDSVTVKGQKVAFRAKGGQPPYFWGVATPERGSIETIAGSTEYAVYTATTVGPNSIVVSDALGGAAVAKVQAGTPTALQIIPSAVTLVDPPLGAAVDFVVVGGVEPYGRFDEAFPELGTVSQGGTYFVQQVNVTGTNILTITDAVGDFANATVEHLLDIQPLGIVPATADIGTDGETALFVAEGGATPMEWSVAYPGRGDVTSIIDDRTIEYTRSDGGQNVLLVEDALGTIAQATITQQDPTPPVIDPVQATVTSNMTAFVFTVAGGTPPYTWAMQTSSPATGTRNPSTGQQTVYTVGTDPRPYTAVIRVTDAGTPAQVGFATINVE